VWVNLKYSFCRWFAKATKISKKLAVFSYFSYDWVRLKVVSFYPVPCENIIQYHMVSDFYIFLWRGCDRDGIRKVVWEVSVVVLGRVPWR
jgi:hypothetical protein